MVRIAATREEYHNKVISNIWLIISEYDIVECLNKLGKNGSELRALCNLIFDHHVQKYVLGTTHPCGLGHHKEHRDNTEDVPWNALPGDTGSCTAPDASLDT